MKSLTYPRTETAVQSWSAFWRDADAMVERARAGLWEGYELRHVSIDAKTGAVTVLYEERDHLTKG